MTARSVLGAAGALAAALAITPPPSHAQDRLKSMPGYDQFTKNAPMYQGVIKTGAVTGVGAGSGRGGGRGALPGAPANPNAIVWSVDGKGVDYSWDSKRFHFDFGSKKIADVAVTPVDAAANAPAGGRGAGGRGAGGSGAGGPQMTKGCSGTDLPPVVRGRQSPIANSPDGKLMASYRDRNVSVCNIDGSTEVAVTRDGNEKERIKYGTASWVYGEELGQTTAMWWNPASTKLAYFRFDESRVPDFYITNDATKIQTRVDVEAYPKPGVPNPVVDLFVYDLTTKKSTHIDVRDGKPFTNDVIGHYVYDMSWSPDGKSLIIHRMNRRQNILELAMCSPETGACKAIIHEEWPTGWVENHPPMRYLADSTRFLWESERDGFKNYYLYNLSGVLITQVTRNQFEVAGISRVDEKTNTLWYTARDGDNYMKLQLHRVGLDGKGDRRVTDPAFTHQVDISPNGKYMIDVAQTHDIPPVTRLVEVGSGKVVAELAKSDLSVMEQRGVRKAEVYKYLAADGKTQMYGEIWYPINFDPTKKYPILTSEYGGPAAGVGISETFSTGNAQSEYGFVMVALMSRAAPGMGKRTLDAIYLKLGQTEMDDMAEGIKALWDRPWVDKNRVGVYGTSYGGYTALMELVRHPDVFTVGSSASPPTDWRNYDTVYTERYMWIPQENTDGYDKGSTMTYAKNLTGRLLLTYGTVDDNVHPNNMMQMIKALQGAGKNFEVQINPDQGHSGIGQARMMEFFIENLIQHPERIHAGYEGKPVP